MICLCQGLNALAFFLPGGEGLCFRRRGGLAEDTDCWEKVNMDDLNYSYYPNSNRLKSITDQGEPEGFDQNGVTSGSYQYDNNGNMTDDPYKGLQITYNHLNLPEQFTLSNQTITILYDANGQKLRQTTVTGSTTKTQNYFGGIEYVDGALDAVYHAQGRVDYAASSGGQYQYRLTDHPRYRGEGAPIKATRALFADLDQNGIIELSNNELLQEHHYYAFGLEWNGPWNSAGSGDDRYRYNGIEHNEETGLDLAFFRSYDPAIGRWMQLDPKASSFASFSPYAGMGNNPISYTDQLGDSIIINGVSYLSGKSYDGNDQFVKDVFMALDWLLENGADKNGHISTLSTNDKWNIQIKQDNSANNDVGSHASDYFNPNIDDNGNSQGDPEIIWNPNIGLEFDQDVWFAFFREKGKRTPAEGLLHELGHAGSYVANQWQHKQDSKKGTSPPGKQFPNYEEYDNITNTENPASKAIRGERHIPRTKYLGWLFYTKSPISTERR